MSLPSTILRTVLCALLAIAVAEAYAEREPPVDIVAGHLFSLKTAQGTAEMPFDISLDWNQPQPQVTRAVVMFHGKGRDVDGYYRATLRAAFPQPAPGDSSFLVSQDSARASASHGTARVDHTLSRRYTR